MWPAVLKGVPVYSSAAGVKGVFGKTFGTALRNFVTYFTSSPLTQEPEAACEIGGEIT